jgi:hypothetical protein
MRFCVVGWAGTRSRLASRNASHFGATSCRAIPIPDKITAILVWNWNKLWKIAQKFLYGLKPQEISVVG